MKPVLRSLVLLTVIALYGGPSAADVEFWPTPSEFLTWPEYCQARFVTVSERGRAEYSRMVPNAIVDMWKQRLGRPFVFIHHHCFGLIWLQRAMIETDPRKRDYDLKTAKAESLFTFERVDEHHPIFAEIATELGTVARAGKDLSEANNFYDIAIRTHPNYAGGYQGKALVLQDQDEWPEARDILLKGDKETDGKSPEINYFLGLTFMHLKDLELARTYAIRAYDLGYPLAGLRKKLAAAGYPIDGQE